MSGNDDTKRRQTKRCTEWAKRVDAAERALTATRAGRDDAIRDAVKAGVSERAAALAAEVSPAHAHAAAKNGRHVASARRLKKKSKK